MNTRVRPQDLTKAAVNKASDDLMRDLKSTISYRTLEPRMAFDGAAAATVEAVADNNQPAPEAVQEVQAADLAGKEVAIQPVAEAGAQNSEHAADKTSTPSLDILGSLAPTGDGTQAPRATIVFVDQQVRDLDKIVSAIDPSFEIVLIDQNSGGLAQIAGHLAGRTDIGSIQIVSHGDAGTLVLGNEVITSATLAAHTADLQTISNALSDDGDILFYGCNVAEGAEGQAFINRIADITEADVAASDDATGYKAYGGDWELEYEVGRIDESANWTDQVKADFQELLNITVSNGNGAFLISVNNTIQSVDVVTGKATLLTTVPGTVGTAPNTVTVSGSINSLAVDQVNGLIYYTDAAASTANTALLAYDYINDTHIVIDTNLTNNGAGKSITIGSRGVGSGAATFNNGTLYLGIEVNAGTNSTIYAITFTGAGKTVNAVSTFGTPTANDWGDLGFDTTNNVLLSFTGATGMTRYNATTGALINTVAIPAGLTQGGGDINGNTYIVGASIQQIDATKGTAIGAAKAINSDGTTALVGSVTDSASWTPATGVIGDTIFFDNNSNGLMDATDVGAAGVSVQLINDLNNNGVVDVADTVLATDTTSATGGYQFSGVLPGHYIVRVTDTGSALTGRTYTTAGGALRADGDILKIGQQKLAIDFGVTNAAPVAVNDTFATPHDVAVTFNVRANDTDANASDTRTVTQVNGTAITAGGASVAVTGGSVALNASGNLVFTPTANYVGATSFTYQVSDGKGGFATATVNGNVTNVTPALDLDASGAGTGWTATYTENGPAVAITDLDAAIVDTDDANMESASVTLSNPQSGDRLLVNGSSAASGTIGSISWTRTDNVVTLTGSATRAQYAAALQQVQFENTTETPSITPRTINTIVSDGNINSNTAVTTINIDRTPDPVNDTFTGNEDTIISGNVLTNDTDTGDGPAATPLSITSSPTNGTLTSFDTTTGAFVYTPSGNYNGSDTFTYQYKDTDGDVKTATVTLTVSAVNDAPVNTIPGAQTVNEDTILNVTGVSVGDVDSAATALTTTLTIPAGSGILNIVTGSGATVSGDGTGTVTLSGTAAQINAAVASIKYTPVPDYNTGSPAVPFNLNVSTTDGTLTDTDNVTITVVPIADITNDSVTTNEDTPVIISVLGNDTFEGTPSVTSINGTAVAVGGSVSVTNGSVTRNADGTLTFSPNSNYNGPASFTYTVTSGGVTETATVNVTITPVNDAPVNTVPVAQTAIEDTPKAITGISVTDVESAATSLTTTLTIPAGTGTLNVTGGSGAAITGDGTRTIVLTGTAAQINAALATVTYTAPADYNTASPFNLSVATSDGTLTDTDTVAITVTPVVDIANDSVTTNEDSPVTFNPFGNDTFEGTPVITAIDGTAVAVGGSVTVSNGTVTLNAGGTLTFTPNANYNGAPSFTYTVTSGAVTETATVNVTVTPVADAPVNVVPTAQSTTEDVTKVITGISVSDADGGTLTTTLSIPAGSGTLSVVTGGGATIMANGTNSVTISGTATQINAAIASVSYVPTSDYNTGTPATPINLTMVTSDGALSDADTIAVTVTPVADAVNDAVSTNEDTSIAFNALTGTSSASADSFENPGQAVSAVTQGTNGTVSFTAAGVLTYVPNANFNGTDTFTYTVTSGGVTETATVTVTVAAVNDVPVNTVPVAQSTTEDTNVVFSSGNGNQIVIADVDSTVTTTLSIANGTLNLGSIAGVTVTGNGTGAVTVTGSPAAVTAALNGLTFAPTADWNGATTLNVSTSDGTAPAVNSSVAVTVTPVADIVANTASTAEDTALTLNVLTNDTFENAGKTVTAVTQPANGSVTIGAGGNVTYTPNANYNGADTFTYTVTSGGVTETTTVTMTVTPVNDAPVNTVPGAQTVVEDTPTAITGVSIADVDSSVTTTLTVTNGTLAVAAGGGATISGNNSGTVTISGTAAQVNAALAGLTYTNTADYNGPATLSVSTTDGTLTDNDTVAITVTPVVDITNDSATTNEDTPVTITVLGNDTFEGTPAITSVNGLAISTGGTVAVTNGTVTLNAGGTLTFTPAANYNGPASFTYTVTSGGVTETATVNVTVDPVNDAPVNTVPGAQTAIEDTPKAITGVSVADVDATPLTTTLTVTNGTINVTAGGGATITSNGSGTVTLNGTAAQINAALAGLTYTNIADYNGPAVLTVQTTDGTLTDSDTIAITVTPVVDITNDSATTNEDTPVTISVLGNDSFEGAPQITTFNGTSIAVGGSVAVTNGSVTLNAGGTLTFTPTANYNGPASFTYTVTSGGVTETATVNVTVNPVNDAPVNTVPGAQTAIEDTPKAIAGVSVADIDGGTLTTTLTVTNGTLAVTAGGGATVTGNSTGTVTLMGTAAQINAALAGLTYTNAADYNGPATLTILTNDGSASDTDTIAITVTPVVDITDDSATTSEDTPVTINALGTDTFEGAPVITSINGSAISTGGTVAVTNGTVTLNAGGTLTFTPNTNYNGPASFSYTVTSGGVTETATVNVTVNPVNDAPVNTVPAAQTAIEDTPKAIAGVLVADIDGGMLTTTLTVTNGTLAVTVGGGVTVTGNSTGTVTLTGTAAEISAALAGLTYTNAADYNGPATLTVQTTDGALTDTDTVAITVTPVVDISNDSATTNEDTPVTINVLGTDSFEGAPQITSVNGLAISTGGTVAVANGTVKLNAGGTLTFTPDANYNGPASFTYTVTSGGVSETATVDITVDPVNDAPVNTVPGPQAALEDTPKTITGVSVADIDATPLTTSLTVTNGTLNVTAGGGAAITGNGSGTVTLSGTAAQINAALAGLSYTNTPDYNGPATITVQTTDGAATDTDTIGITVTPVVDIVNDSATTNEDTPVTISVLGNDTFEGTPVISAINGSAISVGGTVAVSNGTVTLNAGGTVTFTPNADYNGPAPFTYTVTSGGVTETATATITVNPVNDAPVNTVPAAQTVVEDAPMAISGVAVADVDGGTVTTTLTVTNGTLSVSAGSGATISGNTSGTVTISGTAAQVNAALAGLTYTNAADYNGPATLTVQTTDGTATDTDTIAITVTPVVDIANDSATTNEDAPVTISVLGNDTFEGTPAITSVNGLAIAPGGSVTVANGTVTLNAGGTLTFAPNANYNGPASFTYTVTSGGVTETATVNVTVDPVNDAPVNTVPGAQTAIEDTPKAIPGVSVADVDASTLTTTLTVTNGSLNVTTGGGVTITGNGSGTVTLSGTAAEINAALAGLMYTNAPDYNGPATLTVQTTDGAATDTDTVAITVTPVADITNDAVSGTEDNTITFNVLTGTNGATADTFEGTPAVTSVTQPTHGTVTFDSAGNVVYTPDADYNGSDSFTYTVTSSGVTETATVTISVTANNDVPVQSLPAAQSVPEDSTVVFSGALGNQIVIADVDSPSVTTTLSVPAGTLTASSIPGVTLTGNGTGTVTLTGSASAITAALNGLSYAPVADYNGGVTLTVSTEDGSGPIIGTIAMTFVPVADILPDSKSTNEDTAVVIDALDNDNFENPGRQISAINGSPITAGGPAITVANGTVSLSVAGTLTFTPNANYNGSTNFNYTVTSGGVDETANIIVVVTPVNDAPTQIVPAAQTIAEDGTLIFSATNGNAISVADVDNQPLSITLTVTNGTLDLGGDLSGVTTSGDGTGTVTMTGSAAAVNAALANLGFHPTADYNGPANLAISTTDGNATVNNTIGITVTPVVDIVSNAVTTNEDTAITVNVLANDTFEGPSPSVTAVTQGAHGTVSIGAGGNVTYTPADDYIGADSFTYTVTSGGVTETVTVTVTVIPVNDPVTMQVPPAQTTNEDTNVVFSAANGNAITVADIDGDTITVTLSASNGQLTLGSVAGITVSGNGTSTVLITGSAAALNAALTDTAFAPNADYNGPALITISTTDGPSTVNGVIDIDVPPVVDVTNDTVSTSEDTPVTFNVLTGTNGATADTFESPGRVVTGVTQGASGTVTFLANGTLVYTPNVNFHGSDTFTYTITSGGVTETATVTVNIADVNDTPETSGLADRYNLDGESVSVNTAASFFDQDNDTLTYSATGLPPGLAIDPVTGFITGTIDKAASVSGVYTVVVSVNDGRPVGTQSATFTWTVSNPGPTAENESTTMAEDTVKNINVLANDTDPDNDALEVTGATASNGTVTIKPDGTIDYTPAVNFNGTDTLIYQITDNEGGVSTATVTVTVTPVNDGPTATALPNLIDADSQTVSVNVSSAFADLDGDTLTYSASLIPPGLTFDPVNGTFSGTLDPDASDISPFTITVTADDGNGGTASTTFTWRVLNIPPAANDDSVTTSEGTPVIATVLANDTDPDNDPLSISAINGQPITVGGPAIAIPNGSVTMTLDGLGNQQLVFTPDADWNGTTNLVYTLNDGDGDTDTATLTIIVTPINDAPIVAEPLPDISNSDADLVSVGVASYFDDIEIPTGDSLTFTASGLPAGLSISPAGVITGTIDKSASQSGPYTVVVTATDEGGLFVTQSFTWTVDNPAPSAVNDYMTLSQGSDTTVPAATGILPNDSDPDGDALTVGMINGVAGDVGQAVDGSAGGTFVVNANGSYTFTQDGDFDDLGEGETRTTLITYTLSDGNGGLSTASLEITIVGGNDAPVATSVANQTAVDDTPFFINTAGAFTDADGDMLSFSATGLPIGLSIDPVTGAISGTIDPSASQDGPLSNGIYTVTVTADDGNGGTTPVTFTISVTNPGPTAISDSNTVVEDTPVSGNILTNDTDPDGDTLAVTGFTVPGVGSFTPGQTAAIPGVGTIMIGATGAYTFTPAQDYNGPVPVITYAMTDNEGGNDTGTLTLGPVTAVNDAPVSTALVPQTNNDKDPVSLNVSPNFSDVDGDPLAFTATGLPPGLSISPSGVITGTIDHLASGSGPYSVTVTGTDPDGLSTTQTFTWTVTNPGPEAPQLPDSTAADSDPVNLPVGTGFADPDGDTLTFSAAGLPAGLSINPTTGVITGTLGHSASQGGPTSNGIYTVSVTATDSQGKAVTETFTYTVTNPAPVAVDDTKAVVEDTPTTGNVLTNDTDVDGDTLAVSGFTVPGVGSFTPGQTATIPGVGTLTIGSTGAYTFTPEPNYNGPVPVILYAITDNEGGTDTATLTLGPVAAVNDAPVTTAPLVNQTGKDADPVTIATAANFTDIDGDPLNFSANGLPAGLTIDPTTGLISGTIDPSASQGGPTSNGVYTVTVTATDPSGAPVSQSFTYTVTNPAPVATDDSNTVTEDTPVIGNVLSNDNDSDGDAIAVTGFTVPGVGSFTPGQTATIPGVGTITIDTTGAYTFTPAADYNGPVPIITYAISDNEGGADTANLTLGPVAPVNDAPVSMPIANQTGKDNDPVTLNVAPQFSDVDGDALTFTAAGLPPGLTIDPTTGVISGTIDNSASQGGPTSNGVYSITITATDPSGLPVTQTFTYTVTNPAPVATDDAQAVVEDTPVTGNVLANDSDPDGDTLSVTGFTVPGVGSFTPGQTATIPGVGTLSIGSNGAYTFTPDSNYNGPVPVILYAITDNEGGTDTANLTLGPVSPVNDAPVASPIANVTNVDSATVSLNVAPKFSDVDGDTLAFTASGLPAGLSINPATGLITGTLGSSASEGGPASDGVYSITVTATDPNGATVSETFTYTVTNPAPVAVDDAFSGSEDQNIMGSVAGNDSDADGDALTYSVVNGPANGALVFNPDGTFTYTPTSNSNGGDVFTYLVTDADGKTSTATVVLTVTPVNDPPVALDQMKTTNEDTPVSGQLVATDVDGDPLTFTPNSQPLHGTLMLNPDGSYVYTPDQNYSGPDSFTYTVSDGKGGSDTRTVTINVVAQNDLPVAANDVRSFQEDTPVTGNVLQNDSDEDNDPLTVTSFTIAGDPTVYQPGDTAVIPGVGTLLMYGNGTYTFTPAPNYTGAVPVTTYTISDGQGGTDTATLTLQLDAINDAPVAVDDAMPVFEDTPVSGHLLTNDTDADGDPLSVTSFTIAGMPAPFTAGDTATIPGVGTLTIGSDGSFTFMPAPNYAGPVPHVTYTITDGVLTDTATLTLGPVKPANDAPVAVDDTFTGDEDTVIAGDLTPGTSSQDYDVDGDTLSVVDGDGDSTNGLSPISGPAHGTLVLNADGTFSYTPDANFNGTDSFTYRISDGNGGFSDATVVLAVTPVNDKPVAAPSALTTPEDQPFTGTLPPATDADGDAVTYTKGSNPSHGTVTVNPDGTYVYTPNSNYSGPDSFTYTVADSNGGTNTYTVTVMVTPVNDAPVVDTIKPPASKDGDKVRFDVSTFTGDVDGDDLTYSATGLPPGLTLDPSTGLITGTLPPDASKGGPYTVTLTVSDGNGGTTTVTFNWPVKNSAPVAVNDKGTVKAGSSVSIDVLKNDRDPDGDPLTVTKATAGNGSVTIGPDGVIKYTPKPGFSGTDTIRYVISDGNGGFAIATVTIVVGDVTDTPKDVVFGLDGPGSPSDEQFLANKDPGYESITAEGAVVDAVFDIGVLRSIAGELGSSGVVMNAANGVRSLGGIGSIGDNGVVTETIRHERAREILAATGFERPSQDYKLMSLPGFSLRRDVPGNLGGLSTREQVVVESLVREGALIIQISNSLRDGSKQIVDYRITQADGTPLPSWLDKPGKDLLIGRRAADFDLLKLRIEAIYSDGSVVVEEIKIDTATGEIQPLAAGKQGAIDPPMFQDQFRTRAALTPEEIEMLGLALAG